MQWYRVVALHKTDSTKDTSWDVFSLNEELAIDTMEVHMSLDLHLDSTEYNYLVQLKQEASNA